MKKLLIVLLAFGSISAMASDCNVSAGYMCAENLDSGVFSRVAACYAYGEEVHGIDQEEQEKLFNTQSTCESFSGKSQCDQVASVSEKFCAEASGKYYADSGNCYICD